jgi:hypothetical protein
MIGQWAIACQARGPVPGRTGLSRVYAQRAADTGRSHGVWEEPAIVQGIRGNDRQRDEDRV